MEMVMRMLDRMPGVAFCSRMHAVTGEAKWLYLNKRAPILYDVDEATLLANPNVLRDRLVPEDRVRIDALIASTAMTGGHLSFCGRTILRDGSLRWLETHANIEPDSDGTVLWYGQSFDVTERKNLEASLQESEAARSRESALYRQVIDALPVGVMVANQKLEFDVFNPMQQRFTGGMPEQSSDPTGATGVYKADGETPLPTEESGLARGLRGESVEEEVVIRNPRLEGEVRLHAVWTPLRDQEGKVYASLGTTQDITLQRKLENSLRMRNEELGQSETAKAALIERLRYSIDELSNPILEVWDDVLAMPIIGVVDSRRTADMVRRLLGEVARTQASFVIIDLTGVEIVDTRTADHLMKLMKKVEIVGARCVLTGIRPAVAETLVDIGVDFGRLATLRNLKHGLREALRFARREREGSRDLLPDADLADDQATKRRPGAVAGFG
jgi:rsbT co-antagonist protein RsbR